MMPDPEAAGATSVAVVVATAVAATAAVAAAAAEATAAVAEGTAVRPTPRSRRLRRPSSAAKRSSVSRHFLAALAELEKTEAAPMAPAGAPGNYTVYFDFDKAVINAAGQQVINQVLNDARMHPPSSISVTGHTDTVGTAAYNMALGLRLVSPGR